MQCMVAHMPRCAAVPREAHVPHSRPAHPHAGTPQNVTYYGGIGKVTVLWESPAVDPDPSTTKYRLYATPSSSGTRRLLEEGQTSFVELNPTSGSGTQASPYNATAYLPGESVG